VNYLRTLICVVVVTIALPAAAQNPHVAGDFNSWSDQSGADPYALVDDGTSGDITAGDGIYTLAVDFPNPAPGSPFTEDYLILPTGLFGPDQIGLYNSTGNDLNFRMFFPGPTGTATVHFIYDSNDWSTDGWAPGRHSIDFQTVFLNHDATPRTWVAVGSFQSLVGDTDWNPASTISVPRDDGLEGDLIPNDLIFTYSFVPSSDAQGLEWKLVNQQADFTLSTKLGPDGWAIDSLSDDQPSWIFDVTAGETVVMEFHKLSGRMRLLQQAPFLPILLNEVVVTPTAGEFVEIYNPNNFEVGLSGYYLSDRADYYNLVIQDNSDANDFIVRFPPGTVIGAQQVLTVAIDSAGFNTTYAIAPDFDIFDPAMEPWVGAVGGSAGLTNSTETLVLFYWDGSSDLVQDSDYVFWGPFSPTNPAVDKTGVSIDGPDAGDIATAYLDEIPEASQTGPLAPDTDGECIARLDDTEGTEISTAGNGITGHNETSENLDVTWMILNAPGPGCQSGEGLCGGSCIDVLADASNCGACDNLCTAPEVCCLASCSDLMTDPANCGTCSVVCGALEECSLGLCCPSTHVNCSDSCVDLMSDDANCGTCSNICDVADDCSLGICCPIGQSNCSDSCVDMLNDEANCGSCANACDPSEECALGICCPTGQTNCSDMCVDLLNDVLNCGTCANACEAGQECSLGICCPTGQSNCSDVCVDLQNDNTNCGTCSNACGVDLECVLGLCCPLGQENCSGACADLQSDDANCGACSNACGVDESCSLSICCPTGQSNCSDLCVDTQNDTSNCGDCDVTCDVGQNCCAGGCSDPLSDENNCGGCGVVCGAGDECLTGICCLIGLANCSNSCVDLQSDAANCGTCGNDCDAGQVCYQGNCAQDCGELTMCGDSCVDTQTNASHCGVCDNACTYPQAAGICQTGSCQMGACDNLFGDCNGNPADGCEIDLSDDIGHCGDCDTVCSYANALAICNAGTCQMDSCAQGHDDCDTNDSNGCEADLTTPATCGSCFNVCNYAHASGACDQATCSLGTCDIGYGDCNVSDLDGCETDLRENLTDCGACDNACVGTQICFEGNCTDECPAGETKCGQTCVNLQTDAIHCGSCDHSCQPGELCISATCVVPSYSVTGTVRDKLTQQELSGVQLSLRADKETISTIDGNFAFRDVEAGSYQLQAQVAGYLPFSQDVTVADADLVQDVELEPETSSGCGCQAGGNSQSPLWLTLLLPLVVVLRRRSGTI